MNIFKISWEQVKESLIMGASFGVVFFFIGFSGGLDKADLFANLNITVALNALKLGVNEAWGQFWAVALPLAINYVRPDKQ